jgi:hypothetical protein
MLVPIHWETRKVHKAWGCAISRQGQNVPTQGSNIECRNQRWPDIIKCIGYQHA